MVLNKIFGKKNSAKDINSLKERFSQVSANQIPQDSSQQIPIQNQSQSSPVTSPGKTVEVQDALGNSLVENAPASPQLNPAASLPQTSQTIQQPQSQVAQPAPSSDHQLFGQQPLGVALHSQPSQPQSLPSSTDSPQQPLGQQQAPQQSNAVESRGVPQSVSASSIPPEQNVALPQQSVPSEMDAIQDLPSWAVESSGEGIANEISSSQSSSQSSSANKVTETLEQIEDKYYDAKLNSLIIDQVKELIEIDNNLNTKIDDLSAEMKKEILEREQLAKKVDQHFDKVKELERNMEKFLGLYEMVTNQFNPFVDKGSADMFLDDKDKKYENVVVQDPNSFTAMSQPSQPSSLLTQDTSIPAALQPQQIPPQQSLQSQPMAQQVPQQTTIQSSNQWAYCPIHHTIHPSMHFELKNGQKLSSIYDVLAVLEQMDEETFTHHVNLQQNDFSDWIYRVLGLTDLGQQLQLIKTRPEMIQSVRSYIQEKMKSANQ